MKNFIKIETLFTEELDRKVADLSKIYVNKKFLKEKIESVGNGFLDNKNIIGGKRILLKPNWVTHNRKPIDELCLRTHDSFILASLEVILENKPASIVIGDAPIQGCNWEKMLSKDFYVSVDELSKKHSIPIIIKDFRRVTFNPELNNPVKERNPLSDYVIFDLGENSFLEPISSEKNIFRVTSYDPDRLGESHRKGVHKYCITKELFEADIVISLPKVKTHQKAGITAALKNLVGINGDKDFLPHHRVGGVGFGGDCYPGKSILRRFSEYALDNANRKQGKRAYWYWFYLSLFLWRISNPKNVHQIAAGWYGNDTTWRMVMDLNRVTVYGKKDGSLSDKPQRLIFSLCDGIIGGQGDGPLNPTPLPLGIVCFSNDSNLTDICLAYLIRFDIDKIPLIRNALKHIEKKRIKVVLNGNEIMFETLSNYSIKTIPPPGWINYL